MKISVTSDHVFPSSIHGTSAGQIVHDNLVKGLAELGHEVTYRVHGVDAALPEGVRYSDTLPSDADIYHINDAPEHEGLPDADFPWVQSSHCDLRLLGLPAETSRANWIHSSESHARSCNSDRFVYNGLDPNDFIYSETKDDYLFFIVGGLSRADHKGLDIALSAAHAAGVELRVAGSRGTEQELDAFAQRCKETGAIPVGPVQGRRKAELFAGAKALLFPSRYHEGCPLVVLEALFSGTPVISCDRPSMPEIIDDRVGFMCQTQADYVAAILGLGSIAPRDCLDFALERYHYRHMAKNYLREYQREIESVAAGFPSQRANRPS